MRRRAFLLEAGRASLGLATWRFGMPPLFVDEASADLPRGSDPLRRGGKATGTRDGPEPLTLFLCGDVMTGRGIDQALPHPGDPILHEDYVKSARRYLELAERANGPIPAPVGFSYVWGDALEELDRQRPNARVVNLETSVAAGGEPWEGKSVHYRMHPANVPVLAAAGIDCCVLANNHVLDWGYGGLEETLEALRGAGVRTAGAGSGLAEAGAPAVLEARGRRILVFGFGSVTSGIPPGWAAAAERPGVNLLPDLSERTARRVAAEVRRARRAGDLVVASIHWGGNWGYRIPDKERRFARLLIDVGGADIVHGHSSHHAKGIEVYRERPILYGCGDFLTDYEGIAGYEEYRDDLVLMYFVTLEPSGALARLEMTPLRTRRFRLEWASREEAGWLRETLDRESRALGCRVDPGEGGRLALRWDSGG
ncbi:MAG: CapA family protein [Gemmatimonadota bacterium]